MWRIVYNWFIDLFSTVETLITWDMKHINKLNCFF